MARHPKAADFNAELQADTPLLEDVLWRELEFSESLMAGSGGPPIYGTRATWDYYQRRRRAARLRKWAEATAILGAPWIGLMAQDAPGAKRKCVAVGVEMLAACVAATRDAGDWLAKLGTAIAIEVLRRSRIAQRVMISEQTAHRWRLAYAEIASKRADAEIVSVLGRRLLGALFAKAPESSRQLAAKTAASNLFEVLQRETPLEPAGSGEWENVQLLVMVALGDDDAADSRRRSEGKA